MTLILVLIAPALAALYTWNYARWAARQKLHLGAWGLRILALATLGVPLFVLWWGS